jgi:hypothetical protein
MRTLSLGFALAAKMAERIVTGFSEIAAVRDILALLARAQVYAVKLASLWVANGSGSS